MWGARCTLAHWKSSWCWERRRGRGWCKGLLPQGGGWTLSTGLCVLCSILIPNFYPWQSGFCDFSFLIQSSQQNKVHTVHWTERCEFFGHQVGFGEGGNVQEFATLWLGGAEDCDHCHQVKSLYIPITRCIILSGNDYSFPACTVRSSGRWLPWYFLCIQSMVILSNCF